MHRSRRPRKRQPGQFSLLLALIVSTAVMVIAALTLAILLTGRPPD